MRRTLAVLVTTAAFLVPATAASAAPAVDKVRSNASCNSGQQRGPAGSTYNLKGNVAVASTYPGCGPAVVPPPPPPPPADFV